MNLKSNSKAISVNGILNNSSNVNPLPDSIEFDSQRKNVPVKQPIEIVIIIDIGNFVVFSLPLLLILENGPPQPKYEPQNLFNFPRIHVKCESMARATNVHFNFARV